MEFYKRADIVGVEDIHITEKEWQKEYSNSYAILALGGSDMDKIFAAQAIIKIYLVLQAERRLTQRALDAAESLRKPNCGDRDCFECNPPRQ